MYQPSYSRYKKKLKNEFNILFNFLTKYMYIYFNNNTNILIMYKQVYLNCSEFFKDIFYVFTILFHSCNII
ncbi:hypothetical protein PFAG_00357 [Plasmodium falciparum Santa Lucia]|uniref:Uncharacterized protein n=5 Tax=Plasmodium falciparum TaxID=5833 RepID=A0A024VX41_PLAFA|nr:hypothetical protein PFFCH_00123 [Plasmodium falciparum FCH/4]ETW45130.1 hypothetical protein PFNF135_00459 [Plasmodium falciparum NF135/5.C10]ETW63677.1 hypothetical protein PFMC_00424 [Plasmodium falciparum CAMP/Malaysia]EUR80931.1 hypothetical protein PFBG_00297 [Plasmodium falciparum 7G8]EUT92217.1 hypothetical protein PFAG_00357 [Plasmodium falciparum Santa Lucia]